MKIKNYFLKNITLLNILLLAGAAALAMNLVSPGPCTIAIPAPPQPKPAAAQDDAAGAGFGEASRTQTASLSDFMIVAENNLFHPERRIPPEKKEEALPKPDLILFGTLVNGAENLAFIEDRRSPKTSPGRGKRQVTVKKGDMFNGFVVASIETGRIKLVKGEETLVFHLMDAGKQRGEGPPPDSGSYTTPSPQAPPARTRQRPLPGVR